MSAAAPLAVREAGGETSEAEATRRERRARWCADYRPRPGVPDEMIGPDGAIRPAWDRFLDRLADLAEDEVSARFAAAARHIHNSGMAYRVYGEAAERDWPLGVLPLLIEGAEWAEIAAGVAQRASLMETVLADLYGEAHLVAAGLIPAAAVAASPEFLRPLHGVRQPGGGRQLHLYAADLSRGPDGRWRVLADRTQAPSGTGYALENRMVLARALPEVHGALAVRPLAPFFQAFRDGLAAAAERAEPRIALLTSGPYGDTYVEQAVLARYLGFALVEGDDLTVQDGRLFIRTVAGLKRADVLWRRVDGDFVDPLSLNPASRLGVPGLVEALQAGACVMGNMPGAGLVEGGWLASCLPALAEHLFGEPLRLPGLPTWWCGDPAQRDAVLARADTLTLRPASAPAQGAFTTRAFGLRDPEETGRLFAILRDRPGDLVAQEPVQLSTAPAWDGPGLVPRPFVLRVFAAATPGGWAVMPGGFCRVSEQPDVQPVAMGTGVRAADVWVLADAPADPAAAPMPRLEQAPVRRVSGLLPSRAADNLFWLGRYLERAEAMVRLTICLLSGAGAVPLSEADEGTAWRLRGLLHAWGAVPTVVGPAAALAAHALSGREAWGSARTHVLAARRNAASLRERLSVEMWRSLSALLDVLDRPGGTGSEAQWLDRAERALGLGAALSGLAQENMNRAGGWPFVDIGRRIERAINTCRFAGLFAAEAATADDLGLLLQLADSRISYGARYLLGVALAPVRDMVLLDPYNPRSVAFQVERLAEHFAGLPALRQDGLPEPQTRLVRSLAGEIAGTEAAALTPDVAAAWEERLWAIAEAVETRYFPGGSEAARPERLVALA